MRAPPKLRHFMWRACKGFLAVREKLAYRHILENKTCAICGRGDESIIHTIFECSAASEIWAASNFKDVLTQAPDDSFTTRMLWLSDNVSKEDLTSMSKMVCEYNSYAGKVHPHLGVVAKDDSGSVLAAAVKKGGVVVDVAEAAAVVFGLKVARRLGYEKVQVESDALNVVTGIKQKIAGCSPFFLMIDDVLALSLLFDSFAISHVKRTGNTLAHLVAR
ncbi:uncharacterized protein LOC110735807 [Chenopodium quinoa]|uniref:uncharacterized protein LOC110735807 n=1 Tax=Chenopodium quinoa TaxID=63459 RepID=UPI000B789F5D|nr:uncharacterized protein LOC110735807 [Chenopodium quinoa]